MSTRVARRKRLLSKQNVLLLGILLTAACLRAPFTGLPPILDRITTDLTLSTSLAGVILSLPLLAFTLLSSASVTLGRRLGMERAIFCGLVVIAIGIVVRSLGFSWTIFAGSAIIGIGIAVGNVLLPAFIKRYFPRHVAQLTSAYALAMGIAGTLSSALVVPISNLWGWPIALLSFLVLPLIAIIVWLPQLKRTKSAKLNKTSNITKQQSNTQIAHSLLTWQVVAFFGINCMMSYIAFGWLPTILIDTGVSAKEAGFLHAVLQFSMALPGLIVGFIVSRMKDQRIAAATSSAFMAIAFLGLALLPSYPLIWTILLGTGAGSGFILGMAFIGLRTKNANQAASLSGMVLTIGYLLATIGPLLMGVFNDIIGSWSLALIICFILSTLEIFIGLSVGKNRVIE